MQRQLSVLPPALRRPDAQAAAPGRRGRLPRGDAGQPQQPRARRRPGDEPRWRRRSSRSSPRCSASATHLGHLTSQRHDRQPRGAVGRARAAPRPRRRLSAEAHYTHARMCGVLGVAGHAVPRRRRGPHGPRRARRAAAARRRRHGRARPRARPASARSTRVDEALALRERTACACTSTPPTAASSPCWPTREDPAGSTPRRRGDRRARLGRRRPAQARPPAVRLRRVLFADPAVGRFYAHDSPYTYFTSDELHLGEISLECSRAGRGGRRAVADLPAAAADAATGWAQSSPPGAGRRWRWAALLRASDGADACTSRPSSTSSPTSRDCPPRCRRSTRPARACCDAGMTDRRPGLPQRPARSARRAARPPPRRRGRRRRRAHPAQRAHEARARAVCRVPPRPSRVPRARGSGAIATGTPQARRYPDHRHLEAQGSIIGRWGHLGRSRAGHERHHVAPCPRIHGAQRWPRGRRGGARALRPRRPRGLAARRELVAALQREDRPVRARPRRCWTTPR